MMTAVNAQRNAEEVEGLVEHVKGGESYENKGQRSRISSPTPSSPMLLLPGPLYICMCICVCVCVCVREREHTHTHTHTHT